MRLDRYYRAASQAWLIDVRGLTDSRVKHQRLLAKNSVPVHMTQTPCIHARGPKIVQGTGRVIVMAGHSGNVCVQKADRQDHPRFPPEAPGKVFFHHGRRKAGTVNDYVPTEFGKIRRRAGRLGAKDMQPRHLSQILRERVQGIVIPQSHEHR